MRKLLLILLFFPSLAFALGEECGFTNDGYVIPMSSEICKEDMVLSQFYRVFPTITSDAIRLSNLKNKDAIFDYYESEIQLPQESYAVERYLKYILAIAMSFLKLVWVIQVFVIILTSLKDKKLGGALYGHWGSVWRLSFGAFMFMPMGETGTMGAVLLMSFAILSLSMSNLFISTMLSYYQTWSPSMAVDDSLDSEDVSLRVPAFVGGYSTGMVESMLCYQQTQLADVVDSFVSGEVDVKQYLDNLNVINNGVSGINDGVNSVFLQDDEKNRMVVGYLSDESNKAETNSTAMTCGSFSYDVDGMSPIVKDFIANGGTSWGLLKSQLQDELKDPADYKLASEQALSRFYQSLLYKKLNGDHKEIIPILQEIAEANRAQKCFSDPLNYLMSKKSVDSMRAGVYPEENGLNTSCAKINNNNEIEMFSVIKADAIRAPSEENKDKSTVYTKAFLQELNTQSAYYKKQSSSLYKKLIKVLTSSTSSIIKEQSKSSLLMSKESIDGIYDMRKLGFGGYGHLFVSINKSTEGLMSSRLNFANNQPKISKFTAAPYYLSSFYSGGSSSYISPVETSFIKKMKTPISVSKTELNTSNQLADARSDISDDFSILVSKAFNTLNSKGIATGGDPLDSSFDMAGLSFKVVDYSKSIMSAYFNVDLDGTSEDYGLPDESRGSIYARFASSCVNGDQSGFNESMKFRCQIYQRHPVLSFMDLGRDLLTMGVYLYVAQLSRMILNAALKKIPDLGSSGAVSDKGAKQSGMSLPAGKVMNMAKSLALKMTSDGTSPIFIYVAILMIILGLLLGYVIPLMPQVVFSLMYLGWFVYVVILVLASPLLFMSFLVLKGSNEASSFSEKNFFNVLINLILKPFMILMSFTISWILMIVVFRLFMLSATLLLDGMFMNSSTGSGVIVDYAKLLFIMVPLMLAMYKVFNWSIVKPTQVLNSLMEAVGGNNITSRESAAQSIVSGVAAAQLGVTTQLINTLSSFQDPKRERYTVNKYKESLSNIAALMRNNAEDFNPMVEETMPATAAPTVPLTQTGDGASQANTSNEAPSNAVKLTPEQISELKTSAEAAELNINEFTSKLSVANTAKVEIEDKMFENSTIVKNYKSELETISGESATQSEYVQERKKDLADKISSMELQAAELDVELLNVKESLLSAEEGIKSNRQVMADYNSAVSEN